MTPGRILAIVSALWVGMELVVAVLKHARGNASRRDRGSLRWLWGGIAVATILGSIVSHYQPARMPEWSFPVGIALILLGVVLRGIAIATLWRYFTVDVSIREGHELVDRGLYRFIRHPSYSGALLSFIGLGFAFGSWLSLVMIVVASILGFSYRINVEEAVLLEHFGERYRDYMRRSKRLIPGIY
jgi:protein-S-isoprenylcysteine O-methyltransferase Ste14